MNTQQMKNAVAGLSVASNSTLVILKLIIGIAIGSVSVISEAIHSGVDLVAAIIAFWAVKTSSKPADESHAYGHGKIENIAGTIEALLIFLAAGWIIYEAVHKLMKPEPMEQVGWGIAVMLGSAMANMFVSHMLFKVGRKTDSIALRADAMHLRTDVYTSLGVMTGLLIYWIGSRMFPGTNLLWVDPVAAIIVALLIVKAAYELTVESARDLLDARLPKDEEDTIHSYIKGLYPKVYGYHHLRSRKSGPDRYFEFHLMMNEDMGLRESHVLCDELQFRIKNRFPGATVTIHPEPCDHSCKEHCREQCFHLEKTRHHDAEEEGSR
jgi:cation diffusion facilitator family transporter